MKERRLALPARLNVRCSEIGWEMQRGKMAEAAARLSGRLSASLIPMRVGSWCELTEVHVAAPAALNVPATHCVGCVWWVGIR